MNIVEQVPLSTLGLLALLFLWVLAVKGYALWTAARREEKWWFIFFLFFQTLGILELAYIYWSYRRGHKELGIIR